MIFVTKSERKADFNSISGRFLKIVLARVRNQLLSGWPKIGRKRGAVNSGLRLQNFAKFRSRCSTLAAEHFLLIKRWRHSKWTTQKHQFLTNSNIFRNLKDQREVNEQERANKKVSFIPIINNSCLIIYISCLNQTRLLFFLLD